MTDLPKYGYISVGDENNFPLPFLSSSGQTTKLTWDRLTGKNDPIYYVCTFRIP